MLHSIQVYFFLSDSIGYVDESLFVNKKVCPTWQKSVYGMIHASVLVKLYSIPCQQDLDYYFTSVEGSNAKRIVLF
jgi:hypothetical protein